MKINKAKIMVTTLAIAAVAATVGSISGTVAWFQYSTRVTAAYQGAAAHCTENLQIRINATGYDWDQDLTTGEIAAYLATARTAATNQLTPVTSGKLASGKVATKLYKNPVYQYISTSSWGEASDAQDYIVIPLQLRVLDNDGDTTVDSLAKKIYVTDVTMEAKDVDGKIDVTSALRVGVRAGTTEMADYATFATTAGNTNVYGALDLNGDGANDKGAGYDWQTAGADLVYGDDGEVAAATGVGVVGAADTVGVADDSNAFGIVGKEIGSTTADDPLNVELKIYLEGWTLLDSKAIWDVAKVAGAQFNLGIRFSAEAHKFGE